MKTQSPVLRETVKIAVGEAIVLVLMFLIFFLLDRFDATVVAGGLLGACCNIMYFILLCVGLCSAAAIQDQDKRKKKMSLAYTVRLIVLGIGIAIGLKQDCFNNIAVVVPILMTRPIITAAELFCPTAEDTVCPAGGYQQYDAPEDESNENQ